MDQDGIGPGATVGLGPTQGLAQIPTGDQRLDPRHDAEIGVALAVLARLDLTAKLLDIRERLLFTGNKAIGLWEHLVLDADPGDPALLQLSDQAPHVVEVAIAGIPIEEYGDMSHICHELEHLYHLGPAR